MNKLFFSIAVLCSFIAFSAVAADTKSFKNDQGEVILYMTTEEIQPTLVEMITKGGYQEMDSDHSDNSSLKGDVWCTVHHVVKHKAIDMECYEPGSKRYFSIHDTVYSMAVEWPSGETLVGHVERMRSEFRERLQLRVK